MDLEGSQGHGAPADRGQNKDGKPDVYGFGTELEFIFPLAQGTDIVKFKNGNPSLNIDDETWRSSLLYYYDGINKDKVFSPVRWGMWEEFANGNVAMYYGRRAKRKSC